MNGHVHQQPPSLPPPLPVCEDCNSGDRLFLHNVVRTPKSQPQKLCTSCVLQHYRRSCCSECFELFDANSLSAPPASAGTSNGNNRLTCITLKCDNWSHFNCPKPNTPKSPYLCPVCSQGNFKYFDYRKPSEENSDGGNQTIGKDGAKRLLAAAKISAITMNKAAAMARLEADRKVKEAALARKRAKEAIGHVFVTSAKAVAARRELASTSAAAAAVGNMSPGPRIANYGPVRLERNGGPSEVRNVVGNGNVNGNGAVVTVPVPVAVVMPHHQITNGDHGTGENDGGNVAQPQSN